EARFTLVQLDAALANPGQGASLGRDELNGRGFIDVVFTLPAGGSTFDVASIIDLAPEFTLTAPAGVTVALDATQAPVLVRQSGTTATFRYWTSGDARGQPLTLTFLANSWVARDLAGGQILNAASTTTVATTGS